MQKAVADAVERIVHDLVQGTPEWHLFRATHDGSSEAAAMMGLSPHVSRTELMHAKHTNVAKEFSDFVQKNILDKGHELEEPARLILQELVNEDFFPATWSYGRLSASCDGITVAGNAIYEHKQWNAALAASIKKKILPDEHWPQCQQGLHVTGADILYFVVSDGTPTNFEYMVVKPNKKLVAKLIAGWDQFNLDRTLYVPAAPVASVVATPIKALPAVSINIKGELVLTDNLEQFGIELNKFISGLNLEPTDDQGFADAENAVKILETAQKALEAEEARALAQTGAIDAMRKTIALYVEQAKSTRLLLDKMVTRRKEQLKVEAVAKGRDGLAAHIATLNTRLNPAHAYMPAVAADFGGVIKGRSSLEKIRNAIDTELARAKIEANAIADKIQINLNTLRELAADYTFLFNDRDTIVLKENDDLTTLVTLRINTHKEEQKKRDDEQREKLRQEELARIERERVANLPVDTRPLPATTAGAAAPDHPVAKSPPPLAPMNAGQPESLQAGIERLRGILQLLVNEMTPGQLQQMIDRAREIRKNHDKVVELEAARARRELV